MYAFLSVVVVALAGLVAFRWWLKSRPTISPDDYSALKQQVAGLARAVESVANKAGMTVRKIAA